MALRAAICFAALTVADEAPTLSEQMAAGAQQVCFPRGCASPGGAAADPAAGVVEQQLCVQRLPAGATEERLAGRYCGGSWCAAVPAEAIGSVLVARDSRKPGAGPASLLIDRPRRARAGGRTARTMPARGKARQGEGDAHGVRVREVARRSQGQAAEQLHAAPEADSNLCTGHFAQTTTRRSSCAQKPPRFAGLLVVSGRPLHSAPTAEGPLRRAESASASVDASGPSFSSSKF